MKPGFSSTIWTAFPLVLTLLSMAVAGRGDALDNWSTNQVSTNSFRLSQVVYGNGRFVAAGGKYDGGVILSSEDGTTWSLRAEGGASRPSLVWGLTYGGGRFVAVGHFGGISSSTDGINWRHTNVYSVGLNAVAWAVRYVAVGDADPGRTNIFTSTDGMTWTPRHSHPTEVRDIRDIAFGAGLFVAIGRNDGFIYTSSDFGLTWTRGSIPGGSQISYVNGLFFVPFGNGTNLLSTNGASWSAVGTGLTQAMGKVCYAAGTYCARIGSSVTASADGTNWVMRAGQTVEKLLSDGADSGFAFNGHRLVSVGFTGVVSSATSAYICRSDDVVGLDMANSIPPKIVLSGLTGRTYRVSSSSNVFGATSNWTTLFNIVLTNSPVRLADPSTSTEPRRFYRSELLP
jgi:hypothetical protein